MAEHPHQHQNDEPLPDPVAVGHETSDAQSAPILKFLAFLLVVCVVTAGLMVVMHDYLERREAREKVGRYPMAVGRDRPRPAPPRLQTEPFQDIKDLRAAEREMLDRYTWIDEDAGVIRIPIERAIELVTERGLPHRGAQAETQEQEP